MIIIFLIYALIILINSKDKDIEEADYIIVLGSGLNDNQITQTLKNRLDEAIVYLKKYNSKCIVTGGLTSNNTISEASKMYEYLIVNGIDSNRILLENKSKNTIENFKYSLPLINDNKLKIVIISNNYHILRSKIIANHYGYNVKGIGINTNLLELLKHLIIEEIFIIIHYFKLKKEESI